MAVTPSVQISLARMNRVLEVDLRNRWALVEAGVPNAALSHAVAFSPYHYAPDPSSQRASTIGGNFATNAGGLHTLKVGVTVNHILGVEVVLGDGSVHTLGGPRGGGHDVGPDLVGLLCGTEGTVGIVTKLWCSLVPKPTAFRTALAIFDDTGKACRAVAEIIASGIVPAALEMMDGPMIAVVEDAFHLGFPKDAQALLILEVDGQDVGLDADLARMEAVCRGNGATDFQGGSDPVRRGIVERTSGRSARSAHESQLLHAGCVRAPEQVAGGDREDRGNLRPASAADHECVSRGRRECASDFDVR